MVLVGCYYWISKATKERGVAWRGVVCVWKSMVFFTCLPIVRLSDRDVIHCWLPLLVVVRSTIRNSNLLEWLNDEENLEEIVVRDRM
mmetsp:Transcript_40030/g.59371  ORF Transcript_40030/g.59371 Transcript_40030/m.59371 type:complete len:87 (-) Transcript_40030:464-724(-)